MIDIPPYVPISWLCQIFSVDRLLLKKIDRNEFSANEFLYYFKHMTRARQEETADLLLAHGHGGSDEKEVEDGSQSKPPVSILCVLHIIILTTKLDFSV